MAFFLGRQSLRLGLLLLMLSAVIAVAVVRLTGSWTSADAKPKAPSAAQVRLVSDWLARLRLPTWVHPDPTQALCPFGVADLCVTASVTPPELTAALRSAFAAQGASAGRPQCIGPTKALLAAATCSELASYRGAAVAIEAGQRTGYSQPSSWAAAVIQGEGYAAPKPQPLPPLASLHAIPRGWRVAYRCAIHAIDGCAEYMSRLQLRGSACSGMAALVSRLVHSRFSVEADSHYPMPTGEHCTVGASTKLRAGDNVILMGATLTDQGDGSARGALWFSSL